MQDARVSSGQRAFAHRLHGPQKFYAPLNAKIWALLNRSYHPQPLSCSLLGFAIIFVLLYMRPNISHVIFDVDGLLLDTESVYSAISTEILEEYGLKLTYDTKRKIMGRKPLEAASVLVNELSAPFTAVEWISMFKTRLSLDKWHLVPPLPGAEKLVLHLAKHNVPIALATGCRSDELRHKMRNHQTLWKHVSVAVASGDDPTTFRDDIGSP
ncbi:hypothetical protein CRM22_011093 [Opisthorchis felineus]|uniref:Uncharacterized protein n=1 Tax=Opisthorchis felineus TaxID=147828 RepID=A0A4S2KCR6_OPIFE|nr:hypothetical protein CRM22_011093 [Opisthorchis felineus]